MPVKTSQTRGRSSYVKIHNQSRNTDAPRKTEQSKNGFHKYQKHKAPRLASIPYIRANTSLGGLDSLRQTAMYNAHTVIFHTEERVAVTWYRAAATDSGERGARCGRRRKSNEATRLTGGEGMDRRAPLPARRHR